MAAAIFFSFKDIVEHLAFCIFYFFCFASESDEKTVTTHNRLLLEVRGGVSGGVSLALRKQPDPEALQAQRRNGKVNK